MRVITIITIGLLLISHSIIAQDNLLNTVASEVCDCTEKQLDQGNTNMNELMTKCMMEAFYANEKKLNKKYGKSYLQEGDNAKQLGIQIGKILAQDCSAFIDLVIANEEHKAKNSAEFVELAETAKQNNDYEKAITYYGQAIAMEPDNLEEVINDRGITYYSQGDYYHAISDFFRAIEMEPENHVYYYNIAYALYNLGDYLEGIKYVGLTIDRKKNYCNAFNLKGLLYDEIDELDSSLVYFQKAYECDGSDEVKAYNVGYSYYSKGQYTEALEWLLKSESMGYEDKDMYNYIANSYYGKEQYELSLPYHQKHLAYDTSNYIPYYNMGTCHYKLGNYDEAIEQLNKAYSIETNDSDITYYLTLCYKKKEEPNEALAYAIKSIEIDPSRADSYDLRASILYDLGRYQEALLDYSASIRIYPDDCLIYQYIGDTYEKLGNSDKATKAYKKSKELGCE